MEEQTTRPALGASSVDPSSAWPPRVERAVAVIPGPFLVTASHCELLPQSIWLLCIQGGAISSTLDGHPMRMNMLGNAYECLSTGHSIRLSGRALRRTTVSASQTEVPARPARATRSAAMGDRANCQSWVGMVRDRRVSVMVVGRLSGRQVGESSGVSSSLSWCPGLSCQAVGQSWKASRWVLPGAGPVSR